MKDAYYFFHDSNAHNDFKMIGLRLEAKFEGIGIYWTFLEILRDIPNYKYPETNFIDHLSLALSLPQANVQAWLQACLKNDLLVQKDGFIYSESFIRRMTKIDEKRARLQEAGRRGGLVSSQAKACLKQPSSSKVKESKVNINGDFREFKAPTLEEVTTYKQETNSQVDPQSFIDFYASKGWLVGKVKMKDWKAAFRRAKNWNCWNKTEDKKWEI
jgi:hypothetical protein